MGKILAVSKETHKRVMSAKIPRTGNVPKGRWIMESVDETIGRALDALEKEKRQK